MPGGPWSPAAPPTRPGLYINFISTALAAVAAGTRGRVAMIVRSTTLPANTARVIDSWEDLVAATAMLDDGSNNAFYAGRQAFLGGARELRLYAIRGAGSAAAASTLVDTTGGTPVNVITLTAKAASAYYNGVTYTTRANPGDTTKTDLLLYVSGVLVGTYTTATSRAATGHLQELVNLINADTNNIWVTAALLAAGNNTPASVTGIALAGGSNGSAPTSGDYISLLTTVGLDAEDWDVFTMDTLNADISGIEATAQAWFKALRADGKRVAMVCGSAAGEVETTAMTNGSTINQEGVQYVFPGVNQIGPSGALSLRRGAALAAQIAGVRASLPLGQGMTFYQLQDIVSVERRISGTNQDNLIKNGVTVIAKQGTQHMVVKGVTTLVSAGTALDGNPIPPGFKKVAIVNTTDAIAAAIELAARTNYVGKVPNDEDGQSAIIGVVQDFLRTMAGQRAIKSDFTVTVSQLRQSVDDKLYLDIGMTVVDTIDAILMTVRVGA